MKGDVMELTEKAKIRLTHWLRHNEEHVREYRDFAYELKASGMTESARHLREMAEIVDRSNESLARALGSLPG